MKRTGNSKLAVVGWGRGMGHTGHMYLADAVITQAAAMKADPYFFVSKTVGKDDPLLPEEKLAIYQTVFPQQKNIFTAEGNLNQALQELAKLGYQGVVLVVGADQKESFKYLEKPNKEGVPVYQSFGFSKLRVISRQETRSKFRGEEGPRATPMRQVLLDPNASDEQKYEVWRRDMPSALSDEQVADLMKKAESRLLGATKKKQVKEARIMDRNALINAYYVSTKGDRHRVAEKIPYYLLDKLVGLLTKKYNITMNDIEVRPYDKNQYRRSSHPELAEQQLDEFAPTDGGDNGQEDMFFKYAKLWYNGNEQVQQRIIDILDKAGWEIGEIESEEGGAFIVQAGDEDGGSYMGWPAEELAGLSETKVSKYKDLGATNATTHFVKNVTTGKIVSPHRGRYDAEEGLRAAEADSEPGHQFKIVRARKESVKEGLDLGRNKYVVTYDQGTGKTYTALVPADDEYEARDRVIQSGGRGTMVQSVKLARGDEITNKEWKVYSHPSNPVQSRAGLFDREQGLEEGDQDYLDE